MLVSENNQSEALLQSQWSVINPFPSPLLLYVIQTNPGCLGESREKCLFNIKTIL